MFKSNGMKPITHFTVGTNVIVHKANWEHIGKVLAAKAKLRNTPLEDKP